MPTVSDVLTWIDRLIPESTSADWDPGGLQLGDREAPVTTVAICHEVTESVTEAIVRSVPDLVVTYHPLLFRPTNRLIAGRSPAGRAWRLARAGVSLVVAHTSFDGAPGGTADALGSALGLEDMVPFGPSGPTATTKVVTYLPAEHVEDVAQAMTGAGGGRIGNYTGCSFRSEGVGAYTAEAGSDPAVGGGGVNRTEEVRLEMTVPPGRADAVTAALVAAHPYEEPAYDVHEGRSNLRFIGRIGRFDGSVGSLADRVGERLGTGGLRVSADRSTRAGRVAVLPGSGSGFISAARQAGADLLVTGDVDHHRVVAAADAGLGIIDPGHAPTERPGMAALVEIVTAAVDGIEVLDLTGHDPTPWR